MQTQQDIFARLEDGFATEHEETAYLLANMSALFGHTASVDVDDCIVHEDDCPGADVEYNANHRFESCLNCGRGRTRSGMYKALDMACHDFKLMQSYSLVRKSQYQRINHFMNMISAFDGICMTRACFPPETMIWADNFVNCADIVPTVRDLLNAMRNASKSDKRDFQLPAYYKHVTSLYAATSETPDNVYKDHRFTPIMLENLQRRHLRAEHAFQRVKDRKRKNFLNFQYVLRRLLELEGYPEHIVRQTSYLRTPSIVVQHNEVWKKICAINEWPVTLDPVHKRNRNKKLK